MYVPSFGKVPTIFGKTPKDSRINLQKNLSIIIKYLGKNGIEVKPLWYPNHLQKKYKNCQTYKLNNINNIYKNRLCLPSSPQLTRDQQNFICKKLKNIL